MSGDWDFLTNHAHVLLSVANDPGIRLRDIASTVGITERSAHKILSQLCADGYVLKEKVGRRNTYTVQADMPLKGPLAEEQKVGELVHVLLKPKRPQGRRAGPGDRRQAVRPE